MSKNFIVLLVSTTLLSVPAFAYDASVCKNQKINIQKQIEDAKRFNNLNRVKSLEKSLERIQKKCSKSTPNKQPQL